MLMGKLSGGARIFQQNLCGWRAHTCIQSRMHCIAFNNMCARKRAACTRRIARVGKSRNKLHRRRRMNALAEYFSRCIYQTVVCKTGCADPVSDPLFCATRLVCAAASLSHFIQIKYITFALNMGLK
jgi:hypothetical protein